MSKNKSVPAVTLHQTGIFLFSVNFQGCHRRIKCVSSQLSSLSVPLLFLLWSIYAVNFLWLPLRAVNHWSSVWRGLGYTSVRVSVCVVSAAAAEKHSRNSWPFQTLLSWLFCPVKRSCAEYSQYARLKYYSERWSISWWRRWPLSSTLSRWVIQQAFIIN